MLAGLMALLLAACQTIPSPMERKLQTDALAAANGWAEKQIPSGRFELTAYLPRTVSPANTLTLYFEGDGFAWQSHSTPSTDPTPGNPLALRLALAHPTGNAAYLARPCQYVAAQSGGCHPRYWTEARFSPEALEAANSATDVLKRHFGASHLVLVGYSGGGAIAALLAAQRDDVVQLVTVAGNLDHRAWTSHHRLHSLDASLNPADVANTLSHLPQIHFIGGRDRVMPPQLSQRWPRGFIGPQSANLRIVEDFNHHCCWADQWVTLLVGSHPSDQTAETWPAGAPPR